MGVTLSEAAIIAWATPGTERASSGARAWAV